MDGCNGLTAAAIHALSALRTRGIGLKCRTRRAVRPSDARRTTACLRVGEVAVRARGARNTGVHSGIHARIARGAAWGFVIAGRVLAQGAWGACRIGGQRSRCVTAAGWTRRHGPGDALVGVFCCAKVLGLARTAGGVLFEWSQ